MIVAIFAAALVISFLAGVASMVIIAIIREQQANARKEE